MLWWFLRDFKKTRGLVESVIGAFSSPLTSSDSLITGATSSCRVSRRDRGATCVLPGRRRWALAAGWGSRTAAVSLRELPIGNGSSLFPCERCLWARGVHRQRGAGWHWNCSSPGAAPASAPLALAKLGFGTTPWHEFAALPVLSSSFHRIYYF